MPPKVQLLNAGSIKGRGIDKTARLPGSFKNIHAGDKQQERLDGSATDTKYSLNCLEHADSLVHETLFWESKKPV